MKRKLQIFICIVMVIFMLPIIAFAEPGDGNVDGGGGGMGDGTGANLWNPGYDGVRVTVIRDSNNTPVSSPVDYTNKTPSNNLTHFGKVSKIGYRAGHELSPQVGGYVCIKPSIPIPYIVNSNTFPASIAAIKAYFCSEYAAELVANNTGINYTDLISGEYKLLLEPIAYFTYNGVNVGMTATEVALYDMQVGGDLRSKMLSLTHQNLPLAMFLEVSDLGYPA